MANAPHTQAAGPQMELHIRHMPGGKFTDQVFGTMKEKDILRIEGPYGSFYLREDSDKPIVLLASGTGFAPIKAILEHMAQSLASNQQLGLSEAIVKQLGTSLSQSENKFKQLADAVAMPDKGALTLVTPQYSNNAFSQPLWQADPSGNSGL